MATSNRDLKEAVSENQFREDLYYRLNVFPLMWRPLCQRPGDIIVLAKHLIERHISKSKEPMAYLDKAAEQKLLAHAWPGNVRELDNVIQRALILRSGDTINEHAIFIENLVSNNFVMEPSLAPAQTVSPTELAHADKGVDKSTLSSAYYDEKLHAEDEPNQGLLAADTGSYKDELKDKEHRIILETLARCQGKRKDVAETLGISPRTLRYKLAQMRDLGISLPA